MYASTTVFETYLGYWGWLLAINLQIILKFGHCHEKTTPKTTRHSQIVVVVVKAWLLSLSLTCKF